MANITYFFALAFSRTEEGEARAEAAIKALDEEHAISMAARLGSGGRGAVALAKTDVLPVTAGQGLEILARFGEVPDDPVLIRRVSDVWALGSSCTRRSCRFARLLTPGRPDARSSVDG